MGAIGGHEGDDAGRGRRVEAEEVRRRPGGGVQPVAGATGRAVLARRVDALLEEPAVGRADDMAGAERAREVRAADEDVGARARGAGRGGEGRGGEEEGDEGRLHASAEVVDE
jgi:hypothetical protein